MIRTILLDLDDTILADDIATDIAFMNTAAHAASGTRIDSPALISAVRDHAEAIWQAGPFPDWLHDIGTSEIEGLRARFEGDDPHWEVMREWGPGFRHQSWLRALATVGVDDDTLADQLDTMFEHERNIINPWCPGAQNALATLAENYQLGMITNGIPDVQRIKIDATGIEPMFEAIVVSGEMGVGKPEPAIYQHALDLLGANPEDTIMVGDSFTRDVLGAQAFGINAAWISMGRPQPEAGEPWVTIESLSRLPQILSNL